MKITVRQLKQLIKEQVKESTAKPSPIFDRQFRPETLGPFELSDIGTKSLAIIFREVLDVTCSPNALKRQMSLLNQQQRQKMLKLEDTLLKNIEEMDELVGNRADFDNDEWK